MFGIAILACAAPHGEGEIGDFAVRTDLVGGGGCNVQNFTADRKDCLSLAIARLLGAAACAVAFNDEKFGLTVTFARTVGELARQAQLLGIGRGLALDLALLLATQALVHSLHDLPEQGFAPIHIVGEEMVEMIANGVFHQSRGLGRGKPVLGLALELGVANEDTEHDLGAGHHVVGSKVLGLFAPVSSPKPRSPLVSAARSPCSCVPPSGVGTVLQYQLVDPSE